MLNMLKTKLFKLMKNRLKIIINIWVILQYIC